MTASNSNTPYSSFNSFNKENNIMENTSVNTVSASPIDFSNAITYAKRHGFIYSGPANLDANGVDHGGAAVADNTFIAWNFGPKGGSSILIINPEIAAAMANGEYFTTPFSKTRKVWEPGMSDIELRASVDEMNSMRRALVAIQSGDFANLEANFHHYKQAVVADHKQTAYIWVEDGKASKIKTQIRIRPSATAPFTTDLSTLDFQGRTGWQGLVGYMSSSTSFDLGTFVEEYASPNAMYKVAVNNYKTPITDWVSPDGVTHFKLVTTEIGDAQYAFRRHFYIKQALTMPVIVKDFMNKSDTAEDYKAGIGSQSNFLRKITFGAVYIHAMKSDAFRNNAASVKEARKAEVAAKNAGDIASINAATISNVEFMSQLVPNCFKMTGFHKYEPAKITFAQLVEMDSYNKKLANMLEPFSASKVSTGSYTLETIASWAAGENHQIIIK